jgi:hypothetical protein
MMLKNRKHTILIITAMVCFILMAGCNCKKDIDSSSSANVKNMEKPSRAIGHEVAFTATVTAIDYENRKVTLTGPNGKTTSLSVSDDAYNFKNVVVGDLVDINYYSSVVVNLEKDDGSEPSHMSQKGIVRAPEGQKPEGVIYDVVDLEATVENIDYENRTVDLKGTYGNVITIEVDEKVENFNNVKKGDIVNAQYTEAVVISVRAAE